MKKVKSFKWVNNKGLDYAPSDRPEFDDLFEVILENGTEERIIITGFSVRTDLDRFELFGKRFVKTSDENSSIKWIEIKEKYSSVSRKDEFRNLESGEFVSYEEAHENNIIKNGYGNAPQFYISNLKQVFHDVFLQIIARSEGATL